METQDDPGEDTAPQVLSKKSKQKARAALAVQLMLQAAKEQAAEILNAAKREAVEIARRSRITDCNPRQRFITAASALTEAIAESQMSTDEPIALLSSEVQQHFSALCEAATSLSELSSNPPSIPESPLVPSRLPLHHSEPRQADHSADSLNSYLSEKVLIVQLLKTLPLFTGVTDSFPVEDEC